MTDARILTVAACVLAGFLVIGGALFVGSLVTGGEGSAPSSSRASARPSTLPTRALSTPATTTTGPSSPRPTKPVLKAGAMRAFVRSYLASVTTDPAAGWQQLTPRFRNASGGFARYRRFWATITRASPQGIVADPGARTVAYRVGYTMRGGGRSSDSTRLHLVLDQGRYRIDAER